MASSTLARPNAASTPSSLTTLHWLLALQTLVVILGSINRLGTWTLGYVAPNEFLRWVDFLNMLPIPLLSVLASFGIMKVVEYHNAAWDGVWHKVLWVVFIIGVYLLAVSYGDHEVTNYLHARFCDGNTLAGGQDLCRIVIYNDDEFSHYLFFAGFVIINATLMVMQIVFPSGNARHDENIVSSNRTGQGRDTPPSSRTNHNRDVVASRRLFTRDIALLVGNGLFIALGVFANLGFEEIGLDLYVIVLLAVLSAGLLWRYGRQPLLIYYNTAYWVGLVLTAIVKAIA